MTEPQSICGHLYFNMIDGKRLCSECGEPSPNTKAVEQTKTENKALHWPPESKRRSRKRG